MVDGGKSEYLPHGTLSAAALYSSFQYTSSSPAGTSGAEVDRALVEALNDFDEPLCAAVFASWRPQSPLAPTIGERLLAVSHLPSSSSGSRVAPRRRTLSQCDSGAADSRSPAVVAPPGARLGCPPDGGVVACPHASLSPPSRFHVGSVHSAPRLLPSAAPIGGGVVTNACDSTKAPPATMPKHVNPSLVTVDQWIRVDASTRLIQLYVRARVGSGMRA